jgi:hypothetical protein
MKKLTLSIPERLQINTLLLTKGMMIEMEISRGIRDKVHFTPQEIEEYGLKDLPGGRVGWNLLKAKDREFSFEDSEIFNIQKGIKEKDLQAQITQENLDLAKRINDIKIKPKG